MIITIWLLDAIGQHCIPEKWDCYIVLNIAKTSGPGP